MEVKIEKVEAEGLKNCRCSEFEKRIVELELEIEKRKREYQELEAKLKEREAGENDRGNEIEGLRAKKGGLNEVNAIVDLTGENDEEENKMVQLMIENKALECEKQSAEKEVEVWKEKYKELESCFLKFDDCMALKERGWRSKEEIGEKDGADVGAACNTPGTPFSNVASNHSLFGNRVVNLQSVGRQVRKHLSFKEDRSLSKKMAPSTPGNVNIVGRNVVNIFDSDDESDINGIEMATSVDQGHGKVFVLTDHAVAGTPDGKNTKISDSSLKEAVSIHSYGEDMDICNDNVPFVSTPKRKRAANIISSDDDSDEDDNVPISVLKRMHLGESIPEKASSDNATCVTDGVIGTVTRLRRRLATIRQSEGKGKPGRSSSIKTGETKYQQGIPTTDDVEDDESEEVGSESEGESLGGFIVDSSDESDSGGASSPSEGESNGDDTSHQTEDKSDGDDSFRQLEGELDDNINLKEIFSRIRRSKDHKHKWEFEADMLADFGKDAELCMKAVCALYRQQTAEEKVSKETFLDNGRGFSKFDAHRGSNLAVFLTDGNPLGDVRKSVNQLQQYDSRGVELCRTLATRYSRQLFEIYRNKEDPFFLPNQASS